MAHQLTRAAGAEQFLSLLKEGSKALQKAKKVDPRARYVLLFPDDSHVHVGMGMGLLNITPAEKVYEEASEITKKNILKLCLDGPSTDLRDSYENRHLATFVTSHATISKLEHEKPDTMKLCKAAGGFGIGYVNSLVFGGALSFQDGVELVQKQAQAIDRAAQIVPSSKLRIKLSPATRKELMCKAAREHCIKLGVPSEIAICQVTKKIYPHLIEVAGHEEAIKYLEDEGQRLFNFFRIGRVKNSPYAVNTELMRPVKDYMDFYLKEKMKENPGYLREPETCSAYSSTSARRLRNPDNIKKDLSLFCVKPVLAEPLMTCMFKRPDKLAQPNILVVWDKQLRRHLEKVNRRAYMSSEMLDC